MTKLLAHRGLSAVSPENTMDAFTLAWAYDCDGIELDIQISKDQRIIVFHDENLRRVAFLDHNIADMNWEDLRNIDVGSHKDGKYGGERIPLLSQVIKLMPTDKILQLEIKSNINNLQVLMDYIPQIRKDIQLHIICFDYTILETLRKQFPALSLFWVIEKCADFGEMITRAKAINLQGLSLHYDLLADPNNIRMIQSADLLLSSWTVNDEAIFNHLNSKIDMIVSDNPHQFVR